MFFMLIGTLFMVLFVITMKGKLDSGTPPVFMDYVMLLMLALNGVTAFSKCWEASLNGVTVQGIIYATFTVACFVVLRWARRIMLHLQKG